MNDYTITLVGDFEAESVEDALGMMLGWMDQDAKRAYYVVEWTDEDGEHSRMLSGKETSNGED